MPKYIVKPGQRVTHGTTADAMAHRESMAKLMPGQPISVWPPAPSSEYLEGDEIDLTEAEAAAMDHAVCSPEAFDEMASPTAFMAKGYTRDEAEKMASAIRDGREARAKARKPKAEPQKPQK